MAVLVAQLAVLGCARHSIGEVLISIYFVYPLIIFSMRKKKV